MSAQQHEAVTVEILDKEYLVSCPPEEREALLESARMLNERMRQVRDAGKVLGTERMAVITALNIVHEMEQSKRAQADRTEAVGEDLRRLEEKVRQAISRRPEPEPLD